MKVLSIQPGSPADDAGLAPGDEILSINGHSIRDPIDFQFWIADEPLQIKIRRQQKDILLQLESVAGEWFGAELEPMQFHCCGNQCIFCFAEQNPSGLRQALYFKDEDYRLSFLYGNYVTLSHISRQQLQRIVEQKLSPIYVSVHAINQEVRKRMLGLRRDDRLLEKIAFLGQHGIEMHAQIVLVPGWNDEEQLQETVQTLKGFYPAVKTVAIVPVGLTAHRMSLLPLRPVTPELARQMILWDKQESATLMRELGSYFIYLADEFYLLAGHRLPPLSRYEDLAQLENGVGMTRSFLHQFSKERRNFPSSRRGKWRLVTGMLAAPVLQKFVMPYLRKINGLEVELVAIRNDFFGRSITVSGLLAGQDIALQTKNKEKMDWLVIPPNCLNSDKLFLDDWTPARLAQETKVPVYHAEYGFRELLKKLN